MYLERLKKAAGGFRRNLRIALAGVGVERQSGSPIPPPPGVDLLDGLDATPSELVAYFEYKAYNASRMNSVLERMASVGFAVEMGMHEVNSEVNSAISTIEAVIQNPERAPERLARALSSLRRLDGSLSTLSTMQEGAGHSEISGAKAMETIMGIWGHYTERYKVTIEATDAFLNARLRGNERNSMPPLLNLVRNAWYWTDKSDRPRVIRLDAETFEVEVRDFGSDDIDAKKMEDVTILSVSDSGPGVAPEMAENIFIPFVSGRYSAGIGLYLTREHLERNYMTVVLSPEKSKLGGAEFRIGPRSVLEPVPREPLDERLVLTAAGHGIVEMIEDGRREDVVRQYSRVYADLMTEALRVQLEGPFDETDICLVEAATAVEQAVASLHVSTAPAP